MELKHQFMINQLQKLKIKIGNGPDLTNEVVASCWIEEIDDLSKEQFMVACKTALDRCEFFPSTAKFRQFVLPPEPTPEELAIDAADRIVTCLSTCGYTNPTRAKEQIGELGWVFVEKSGGWSNLCLSVVRTEDLPTLRAQWRRSIMAIYNQALRGDTSLPALPAARVPGLQPAKDVFKIAMGG